MNIASVAYYFGDKMGLYRAVMRQIRDEETRRFPIPDPASYTDPTERLFEFVRTLLRRMLDEDQDGWQVRLLMHEIQQPTEALGDIITDHFAPFLEQLCQNLADLIDEPIDPMTLMHLGLSVVGQCFHYRVSEHAIKALLNEHKLSAAALEIDTLAVHITSVTLAAVSNMRFIDLQAKLRRLID